MQEQEQNRTEPATAFKLSEAEKRGQVAKSLDFNSLLIIAALLATLAIWGQAQWLRLCELCAQLFAGAGLLQLDNGGAAALATTLAVGAVGLLRTSSWANSTTTARSPESDPIARRRTSSRRSLQHAGVLQAMAAAVSRPGQSIAAAAMATCSFVAVGLVLIATRTTREK